MALYTGTNEIRLSIIDSDNGKVKAEARWLELDYNSMLALESAMLNAALSLGQSFISERK